MIKMINIDIILNILILNLNDTIVKENINAD